MSLFESHEPEFEKALGLAMGTLARQPRSEDYIRKYLQKKKYEASLIHRIIEYLQERNYINDREYAQWFIRSRVRNNPKSCRVLSHELKQKGVAQAIFEPLLEELDDQALAFAAVERKMEAWQKQYDREKWKKKLFSYLSYRGFGFMEIRQVWDEMGVDE